MSENCDNNCLDCESKCEDQKNDFREKPHDLSDIKKVIGVVSGKGGVGKSLVTALLAVAMNRNGYNTAILDADITGPSIPRIFGLSKKAISDELGLYPVVSKNGIKIMSINLLLQNETDPVIWRGPLIGNTVKQFWTDVIWGEVDYLLVDMPPGTGDVALTVFQSIPVDGVIIVTSPQELVSIIVEKAANMAKMMKIPILGIVENMSYFNCPDCGSQIKIFGESHVDKTAKGQNIDTVIHLPIDSSFSSAVDKGMIESIEYKLLDEIALLIEKL